MITEDYWTIDDTMKIERCDSSDFPHLVKIWERSVRATHDFLTEEFIEEIKKALIPIYFPKVELYKLNVEERTVGFVGLSGDMIEMLFIDSECMHKGYGSVLIEFSLKNGSNKVDVNEQNPSALSFYLSKGFTIQSRDTTDETGRPFPILHLVL